MIREIAPEILLITDNDAEFTEWCHGNPNGFVWTCWRGADPTGKVTAVWTLHSAITNADLCSHFKNKNRPGGYEANLTTKRCVKVCSTDRQRLEKWAEPYPGDHKMCSSCIGLP